MFGFGYNWVHTTRVITLTTVVVFSVIVLACAADWISSTESNLGGYFKYAALAVATALLTILTVPAMLAIDRLRRGAFTSLIVAELSWLGFLWIMWLATGAYAANEFGLAGSDCSISFLPSWFTTGCEETQAIIAFSFLNWIALTGYLVSLLVVSTIAATRNAPVWFSSVKEANFSPVNINTTGALGTPELKAPAPQGYPQQAYPPQQVQV